MFDFLNIPLGWIIKVCYEITNNYAVALLFFALALQILLLPFGIKQQKNSIKQAKLDPKIRAIRKKYAGRTDQATQQKIQNETMEVYQKEGYNPMGGCLPLLIQMPILFSLYNVVINPFKYICGYSDELITNIRNAVSNVMANALPEAERTVEAVEKISKSVQNMRHIDLIAKMKDSTGEIMSEFIGEGLLNEELIDRLPNFTFLGMDLSQTPSFENFGPLLLIPLITLIVTLGSTYITKKFTYQPNQEAANTTSMKVMQLSMPLLSVWICFTVAGAVGLYWIFRNILSVIERIILSKAMPIPVFTEEDYKKAEKEANVKPEKKKNENKGKVRSLHRIDEDDEIEAPAPKAPEKKQISGDAPKLKDESDRHKKDENTETNE